MDDRDILMDALKFHGHRCWASVSGVRVGLAALRALGGIYLCRTAVSISRCS